MITAYQIVEGRSGNLLHAKLELDSTVNVLLGEGWQPYGSPLLFCEKVFNYESSNGKLYTYAQAMTKEE